MTTIPRPNIRVGWQTCLHCLAGWYGPDDSPCPDCAAVAGTVPRRWAMLELVLISVVAVLVLLAAGFLVALGMLR